MAEILRLNVVGHSNVGTPKTTYLQWFCGQWYGLSMALQGLLAVYVLEPKLGFEVGLMSLFFRCMAW